MTGNVTWKTIEMECPEAQRMSRLLLGLVSIDGGLVLNSIHCDHPRLRETENWDCNWSCVERISTSPGETAEF